jgi:hypothetical protein
MSSYYDSGPFSIDQWNKLIQDINDKLANPPEGCTPIDPLEEVEDPHLWAQDDVTEVRNKMIESCPDISFTEDLEIWHYEIIDEIEEQISDMWCDCEECTPVEVDVATERVGWTTIDACCTEEHCGIVSGGVCYYCIGMDWFTDTYTGVWYPPLEGTNVTSWNKICDTYTTARQKQYEFIQAVNATQQKACQLAKEQATLDEDILPQLDAAIAEYLSLDCDTAPAEEDIPQCEALRIQICDLGSQAQDQQNIIDTKHDEYLTEFNKIEPARTACDNDAAENMAACVLLQTRLPAEWQGMQWALPLIYGLQFNWWKWFNPKSDSTIAELSRAYANTDDCLCEAALPSYMTDCTYNSKGCLKYTNHQGCGLRPSIYIDKYDSAFDRTTRLTISLSPNGTPFLSYDQADDLLIDQTVRTFDRTSIHRCDAAPPTCTEPCSWGAPETLTWYWTGGDLEDEVCGGLRGCYEHAWCAFIYSGVVDTLYVPSTYLEYTLSYKAVQTRIGKDYTTQQTEFYDEHQNWFSPENHPKYDNRHEDYC